MIIKMIEKKTDNNRILLHGSFRRDGNWGGWSQYVEIYSTEIGSRRPGNCQSEQLATKDQIPSE